MKAEFKALLLILSAIAATFVVIFVAVWATEGGREDARNLCQQAGYDATMTGKGGIRYCYAYEAIIPVHIVRGE